jgi:eukaryotic-like serine/threonine-protein kinase
MSTILQADMIVHTRYRVVCLMGQGGMGAVYEAIDQTFGSRVALKQMFPDPNLTTAQVKTLTKAFEREAHILNNLRHPALPRVTEYFFDDKHGHFLVMGLHSGQRFVRCSQSTHALTGYTLD